MIRWLMEALMLEVTLVFKGSKRLPIVCMSHWEGDGGGGGVSKWLLLDSLFYLWLSRRAAESLRVPKLLSAGEADCLSASAGAAPLLAMTLHIKLSPSTPSLSPPPYHRLCPSYLSKHARHKSPLCRQSQPPCLLSQCHQCQHLIFFLLIPPSLFRPCQPLALLRWSPNLYWSKQHTRDVPPYPRRFQHLWVGSHRVVVSV